LYKNYNILITKEVITSYIKQIRKSQNLTQAQVADFLGISISSYNKIENNDYPLPIERLFKIMELLGIDLKTLSLLEDLDHAIQLVPTEVQAGFLEGTLLNTDEAFVPFSIPIFHEEGLFMVASHGDSMLPTFQSGTFLILKKLEKIEYNIRWGSPYVLITKQGKVFKRVFKHKSKDKLILRSDNELYPDQTILKSSVCNMFEVRGTINQL